jgi:N-acylneuraminate cytidylyltransferase
MKYVAIIPARGGSKGIPHKNLKSVGGKPLVLWSVEHALSCKKVDSVWVTSDSDEILDLCARNGARPIKRPLEISGDEASSEAAWIHAIEWIENLMEVSVETVVGLQPTSPVRSSSDLDAAIEQFERDKLDSLMSATATEDHFQWVIRDGLPLSVNYDFRDRKRRQDLETKYLENGSFYIFKREIITKERNRLGGRIGIFRQEQHKMFQIDNAEDIELIEAILNHFE